MLLLGLITPIPRSIVLQVTHIPIIPAGEATRNFEFSRQAPVHAPDLRNLASVEKLENYMMILTALEENLAEYKAIREDLDKMFDVVCELNVQDKVCRIG